MKIPETRKHSSRMRTAHLLTGGGAVQGSAVWGCCCLGRFAARWFCLEGFCPGGPWTVPPPDSTGGNVLGGGGIGAVHKRK